MLPLLKRHVPLHRLVFNSRRQVLKQPPRHATPMAWFGGQEPDARQQCSIGQWARRAVPDRNATLSSRSPHENLLIPTHSPVKYIVFGIKILDTKSIAKFKHDRRSRRNKSKRFRFGITCTHFNYYGLSAHLMGVLSPLPERAESLKK